jgi:thioredoxin reductase
MTSEGERPLVTLRDTGPVGRRRVAPRAFETSDVTRFRGLGLATALGMLAALLVLVVTSGSGAFRAPGPQSRPHRVGKLECKSCHKDGKPAASACKSCHGSLPSERPGHQELRAKGEMGCPTCHAIHRADEGVSFLPSGEVIRYGTGWEAPERDVDTLFHPLKPVSVPLVPARACAKCHDLSSERDPIAACLIEGQEKLGVERPTVCFDEHRAISGRAGTGAKHAPGDTTERDAAWEAARTVAARGTRPARRLLGATSSIFAGVFVALLSLGVSRFRTRRRARAERIARAPKADVKPAVVRRLPQVDATTCLGCYACVDACPYDVLEVRRFVAVVARADDCCGLTLCEQRCPNGSLVVREGEPIDDRPTVNEHLESKDVPGLYLAGDLTGLPLIRNAINQGAVAVASIRESLELEPKRDKALDLLIVGAGPAGISAALAAKEQGLRAKTLEQSSVAASIKSFPRGKLVFDQPLGMPLVGDLWLEESSKEELLGKWLRVVRRAELDISEGRRVTGIAREPDGSFQVSAENVEGRIERFSARRVLLAIGRRGTPRRLPAKVAADAEDRVFYSLADARTFAGASVVIVGLGDTAMEAAIALARQPDTQVTIAYRGSDFRRGKARNIDEMRRLVDKGRIRIVFEATVTRVERHRVEVSGKHGSESIKMDALFVMIGAILPWEFLSSIGVKRGV